MPNRKKILYVAAGLSAITLGFAIFKSRKSAAAPKRRRRKKPKSIVLIGDSQTARHLGTAFDQIFCDYDKISHFGQPGATHENYLNLRRPYLSDKLANLECADVVYIQLGDNGISNNASRIKEFVSRVKAKCPKARIFWGGPMKAVPPTTNIGEYVNTDDPNSPRYLPTYNNTRKVWIDRLRSGLEGTGVTFVDNYALQEAQPRNSNFSDHRGGDGIHLTAESAWDLAALIREIVEK